MRGGLLSWKSRQEGGGGSFASGNPGERGVKKTTPSVGEGDGFFLE